MARPLRIQYAGAWYHLTGRGNERQAIFKDDRDRLHFIELLEECVERYRLRICGYALMDNHWHGFVQLAEPNLSAACQWLGVSYATWFNRRHQRVGHLFQGRFKGILVDGESYGCEVSRYLHLNPVRLKRYGLDKRAQERSRAGALERPPHREVLAERLRQLRAYRWSSYRAYVGLAPVPDWLDTGPVLQWMGGGTEDERRRGYRKYVEQAVREGLAESVWEKVVAGAVLGGPEFVAKVRRWLKGNRREQPALRRLQRRIGLEDVIAIVERLKGERWAEFRDRHGDRGRDVVLYLAQRYGGLKLRELGEQVGGIDYTSVGLAIKRIKTQARSGQGWTKLLREGEREVREAFPLAVQ